jgi:hypothetical protein
VNTMSVDATASPFSMRETQVQDSQYGVVYFNVRPHIHMIMH